jgi:hypothetical protein
MPRGVLRLGRKRMPISNYVVTNKSNRQIVAINPSISIAKRCAEPSIFFTCALKFPRGFRIDRNDEGGV